MLASKISGKVCKINLLCITHWQTPLYIRLLMQLSTPRSFWAFDMSSWMSWMSYSMYALAIVLLVLWYSTHRRLTILATALSVTAGRASAYELKDEFKLTTTTLSPSVNMMAIVNSAYRTNAVTGLCTYVHEFLYTCCYFECASL
jgi:hypothetical protein